jgi:hypothetical protein
VLNEVLGILSNQPWSQVAGTIDKVRADMRPIEVAPQVTEGKETPKMQKVQPQEVPTEG